MIHLKRRDLEGMEAVQAIISPTGIGGYTHPSELFMPCLSNQQ
jgi:hypothetical protein